MKIKFDDDGDCIKFLGQPANIFISLHGVFSRTGRSRALAELSDLFQIQSLVDDAELFFITPRNFLSFDFSSVDEFINEKFGLAGSTQAPASAWNIFNVGRSKLTTDLCVLNWFLDDLSFAQFEVLFEDNDQLEMAGLPSTDSQNTLKRVRPQPLQRSTKDRPYDIL